MDPKRSKALQVLAECAGELQLDCQMSLQPNSVDGSAAGQQVLHERVHRIALGANRLHIEVVEV